jgi:hypothetical protein
MMDDVDWAMLAYFSPWLGALALYAVTALLGAA